MPFDLVIPLPGDAPLNLVLSEGEIVFVLGANGSGKSSLMHKFYNSNHGRARRITAHRQTWFSSNAITLSPEQKRNTETNMRAADTNPQARWQDGYSSERASIALFDLIDAENVRARSITASPGTLVLIDEPERHLHRSIIAPLLTLLFAKRPDCAFVISTHEVMLSLDNPGARTLLLRGCTFEGSR